jgi:hypothetical protein
MDRRAARDGRCGRRLLILFAGCGGFVALLALYFAAGEPAAKRRSGAPAERARFEARPAEGRDEASAAEAAAVPREEALDAAASVILAGRVLLRARDGAGATPVPGARLRAALSSGGEALEAETDAGGRFEISGLTAEASAAIGIDHPGAAPLLLELPLPAHLAAPGGARLELGELVLEPAVTLVVVLSGPDGEPIDGATVRAASEQELGPSLRDLGARERAQEAEPRGGGRYHFERLAPGFYYLCVTAPGFGALGTWCELPQEEPLELELAAACRIAGRVLTSTGKPIAGARMEIMDFPARETTTDDSGAFAFDDLLPSVSWSLHVKAEGFHSTSKDLMPRLHGTKEIEDLEFWLFPEAVLSGRLLDERGAPAAGAELFLTAGFTGSNFEATTDVRGSFTFDGLPPGECRLHVDHCEHLPLECGPFVIAEGERLDLPAIQLAPGLSRRGRVVDAHSGSAVPGAKVSVQGRWPAKDSAWYTREALTGADGGFLLVGLAPGDLQARAHAVGYRGQLQDHILEIGLATDDEWLLEIEKHQRGLVTGRVFDPDGLPLTGVKLGISPATASTRSDVAGRYTFDIWSLSRYTVTVDPASFAPQSREGIEAGPGLPPAVADFRLRRGGSIRGSVRDELGRGVPGAEVSARDESVFWRRNVRTSGRDGRFELHHLPAGRNTLFCNGPEGHFGRESLTVEVPEEGEVDGLSFILRTGERVSGRVVDGQGRGVGEAWVALFCLDDALMGFLNPSPCRTGPDGGFEILGLQPGPFGLSASRPGFTSRDLGALIPGPPLQITLEPLARLKGRVRSPGRTALPAGLIRVDPESGVELPPATDETGRFAFVIEPGRYRIAAGISGFAPRAVEVALAPGELREIELELAEGWPVEGVVVDRATGEGISDARVRVVPPHDGAPDIWRATDDSGGFLIEDVPAGEVVVLVEHARYLLAALPAFVFPRAGARGLRIELAAGRGIRGVITERSLPAGGAAITLRRSDGAAVEALSDDGGRFEVAGLEEGSYELEARGGGRDPLRPLRVRVEVGEAWFNDIDLDLAGVELRGRMRGGEPGEYSLVRVFGPLLSSVKSIERVFSAPWSYRLVLPGPGTYVIRLKSGKPLTLEIPEGVTEVELNLGEE